MAYDIASDLSYLVFQKRRQCGEFGPCALDSINQHLHAIPSLIANRRAFVPDTDEYATDAANPNPLTAALGARE